MVGVDDVTTSYLGAGYIGQWLLVGKELVYNDGVYSLCCRPGDSHDYSVRCFGECRIQLVIINVARGTKNHRVLEIVQLFLRRLHIAYEIKKSSVIAVHYTKLLVKGMLDGIFLYEGIVI